MFKILVFEKGGKTYIRAGCGDTQDISRIRAARLALRKQIGVYHEIINNDRYELMTVDEAKKLMTPKIWVEHLLGCGENALTPQEANQMSESFKNEITTELIMVRTKMHAKCLQFDKEMSKITNALG